MVLLGLMGGAKTETPLDLSQILFKRLRIEGQFPSFSFVSIRLLLVSTATDSSTMRNCDRYYVEVPYPGVSRETVAGFLEGSTWESVCESERRRRIRSRYSQG